MPNNLQVSGSVAVTYDIAGTFNASVLDLLNNAGTSKFSVSNNPRIQLTNDAASTNPQLVSVVDVNNPSAGLAVVPAGTGAITMNIPDNGNTNGNARGNNAIDFQRGRNSNVQVPAADSSAILGGSFNSITDSTINYSSNTLIRGNVICGGTLNTIGTVSTLPGVTKLPAAHTILGGQNNANFSVAGDIAVGGCIPGGTRGMISGGFNTGYSPGRFGTATVAGDAQTTTVLVILDGSGTSSNFIRFRYCGLIGQDLPIRLVAGANNARAWAITAEIIVIASSNLNGTSGQVYSCTQVGSIKNVGGTCSIVGGSTFLTTSYAHSDTDMSNGAIFIYPVSSPAPVLIVEFQPPSLSLSNTFYRGSAMLYITEIAR